MLWNAMPRSIPTQCTEPACLIAVFWSKLNQEDSSTVSGSLPNMRRSLSSRYDRAVPTSMLIEGEPISASMRPATGFPDDSTPKIPQELGQVQSNAICASPDDGICLQFGVKPPGLTADLCKVASG